MIETIDTKYEHFLLPISDRKYIFWTGSASVTILKRFDQRQDNSKYI